MQYAITAKYVVTQTRYVTARSQKVADHIADQFDGTDFDPDGDIISAWGIDSVVDVTEGDNYEHD